MGFTKLFDIRHMASSLTSSYSSLSFKNSLNFSISLCQGLHYLLLNLKGGLSSNLKF